ncbi:hypothetical protein VD0002_g8190 [Verticillium dahliae]|uniref:Sucrose-6-phosphate hydrolase n=1 Tax=Verticillium dahliae TaxID=27337 RepID=A0AA44WLW4_VERDA|nr:Non-structural maintenance of chromosomes element 4-like protein A [Verticillium dahliae VDG2]KAH6700951.1 glycosyl hydrolases family 32 superfamily [Verticillium dahliae]PNH33866.1 hypothetical protein BJF96_g2794 [Verticillium dahliae]PNH46678.1 hypothetical protein VD0003_g8976 [Verticillium dahliae]PNH59364.1 hypothetical protein VD0002_g8190 [Verticillium dahliae]
MSLVTTRTTAHEASTQARLPLKHHAPSYHLKARGWMNDPCGPGYNPITKTYHIFYQWNPYGCEWGNMSWGHATSQDGLRWTHAPSGEPALKPSEPYDKEGIFTGCFWPTGPHGEKDQLTVVYSSIAALPIHWTLKHIRNSEGVSLATSTDAGKTWQKSELNPILVGEPEDVEVTGFRDPFLAEWPALDLIRGEKSLYGFLSGGVVGKGPTVFLYAIQPDNLTEWKYLGPLVDLAPGFRAPGSWTGNFGVNWECVNFLSLQDGAHEQDFLLMGTEGGVKPRYKEGDEEPLGQWSSWFSGSVEQTAAGPRLRHEFDGVLDHGSLYAPNSYVHPETQKRITIGWVREDGLPMSRCKARGWTGFLSLPRELFLSTTHNVTRGLQSPIEDIRSFKILESGSGGKTVKTLGIKPMDDLRTLRPSRPAEWSSLGRTSAAGILRERTRNQSWELDAVITVDPRQRRVGFNICQSPDGLQRTTVYFTPQTEQIVVDKSLSNTEADVDKSLLDAPFTLLYSLENGTEKLEKLRLRIFRDGDVLEVFANDRFALTTTVYCDDSCAGISWFLDDEGSHSVFDSVQLWEDMAGTQGQVPEIGQPHL